MMNERFLLSLRLILSHVILLPLLILISLFTCNVLFLLITISQTVLLILLFSGYWEFLGSRFKRIYFTSSELWILIVFFMKLSSGNKADNSLCLVLLLAAIQAWLLFLFLKMLIVIYKTEKGAVEIVFPFKQGKYLITDGGNSRISRLMNYHFYSPVHKKKKTNLSMLYATDIVKIKNSGINYLPPRNIDYPIFSEKVYSPVSGIVVKVEDGINDNVPYCGNYPYNTGNTIVIRQGENYLLLGHLKMDSIRVKTGDVISADDLIAEAGNSGYSERPHIHMQLIHSLTDNFWTGTGVSIQFKKKNLYKNRLIEV